MYADDPAPPGANTRPRLLEQVRNAVRRRHYSSRTRRLMCTDTFSGIRPADVAAFMIVQALGAGLAILADRAMPIPA